MMDKSMLYISAGTASSGECSTQVRSLSPSTRMTLFARGRSLAPMWGSSPSFNEGTAAHETALANLGGGATALVKSLANPDGGATSLVTSVANHDSGATALVTGVADDDGGATTLVTGVADYDGGVTALVTSVADYDVAGTWRAVSPLLSDAALESERAARSRDDAAFAAKETSDHTEEMTPSSPPAAVPQPSGGFDAKVIFPVLGTEKRRSILVALAAGEGRAASQLTGATGLSQDATLKHLVELRAAGLVTMARDANDERRQLYTLSSAIIVNHTATGLELDFGCCVVRV